MQVNIFTNNTPNTSLSIHRYTHIPREVFGLVTSFFRSGIRYYFILGFMGAVDDSITHITPFPY